MRPTLIVLALSAAALLSGCELLGLDSPEKIAAAKEADGKAIGSACRHAGRAIEDCYVLNAKAQRAAVFAGWREMDEYMRENKLEVVAPVEAHGGVKAAEPVVARSEAEAEAAEAKPSRAGKGAKAHSS
jgi:predicted flap endonuclease-1-like 5' DNA nuclease